jgi:HSP20 family protein
MIVRRLGAWGPWWSLPSVELARIRREMEGLLDQFVTRAAGDLADAGVFPPVNVSEDADHYYVRALLPGVDAQQLEISAVNQTLTVSGARRAPREAGASYHRRERPEGEFSRSVTLPNRFDADRIQARYVDGVLTVTLPKPEAAKPRRVTVQTA